MPRRIFVIKKLICFVFIIEKVFRSVKNEIPSTFYSIRPASTMLAAIPAMVASSAPFRV